MPLTDHFKPRMRMLLPILFAATIANLHGSVGDAIHALTAIESEGRGNESAGAAWTEVIKAGPTVLPSLLAAAGKGGPVADNWVRLACDAVVDAALKSKHPLPLAEVEAFLKDTQKPASGRQLAFDVLQRADSAKAEAIEPSLIHDPVQELRRGAVQRLIEATKGKDSADAKAGYLAALDAARDEDQAKFLAGELKKLGVNVDLPKHFGFLMKWQVIGAFDNTGRNGFDTVFPPEKEIRLDATYDGKSGPAKWQAVESTDDYGKLNFNKPLGLQKEVTGYAMTTIDSAEDRDAELRLGCKNAWKVWLNGELLFGRDEYHRGQQMDQYKLKCRLRKGPNTVLVKCCQNEQKEEWTVEWEFQLRVCDSAGTAILAAK